MLSRPTKPGVVVLYDGSGQEISRSAPQEAFLVPSENNSNVVPPFNAYAPAGSVRVSGNLRTFSFALLYLTSLAPPFIFLKKDLRVRD